MEFKKIKFPEDELAHDCIIEWWYFNGNLKDKNGNEYAFMDCLFKADVKKAGIPFLKLPFKISYFSHSLLSDIKNQKLHQKIAPLSIISTDSFSKPLLFINYTIPSLKGYTNYAIECTEKSKYRLKTDSIDLILESVKKPLLVGGKGFIDLRPEKTYYYSLTNLRTKGRIKIEGKWIDVEGKSWMDHQWADVPYKENKWSWFSIQLNDDTEILCFQYGKGEDLRHLASISYRDNKQKHFNKIEIAPLGENWQSERTGAIYPLAWEIKIPEEEINLTVKAKGHLKNNEINFGTINYWEGSLDISGNMSGKKIKGEGFMELVGYSADYNKIKFLSDKAKDYFKKSTFLRKNIFGVRD